MEEQKNKEIKTENTQDQRYTYEQLNGICEKLFQENQQLRHQLQQTNKFIQTINRLDYLFKVVEIQNSSRTSMVFRDDFYYACVNEIQDIMTVPEESDKEAPKEN